MSSTEKTAQVFKGQTLHPFTPQRQSVALQMGMKFGFLSEEDGRNIKVTVPVDKPKRGQPKTQEVELFVYNQVFKDAMIVVWLSLQPTSRVVRAERLSDEAVAEMWKWADKEGVNIGTPYAEMCNTIFYTTMGEIIAAKTMPLAKHPSDEEPEDED